MNKYHTDSGLFLIGIIMKKKSVQKLNPYECQKEQQQLVMVVSNLKSMWN